MVGRRLLQVQKQIAVRLFGRLPIGRQQKFWVIGANLSSQMTDLLRIPGVFEQTQRVGVQVARPMRVVLQKNILNEIQNIGIAMMTYFREIVRDGFSAIL